jgi:hypothetical protein
VGKATAVVGGSFGVSVIAGDAAPLIGEAAMHGQLIRSAGTLAVRGAAQGLGALAASPVVIAGAYGVIAAETVYLGYNVYQLGKAVGELHEAQDVREELNVQLRAMGHNPRDTPDPGILDHYGTYISSALPWNWGW